MTLWTPANSSVQPLLLMMDANAVWSGSNLSSIINAGSEGGSFSLRGTPDKGTAINGLDPVRFDANTEVLYKALDFPNSGKLSLFHYSRLISAGVRGVVNREWNNSSSDQMVYYCNVSGAGLNSFIIANRDFGVGDSPPAWEATAQFQTTGNINSVYGQVGATNDAWVDGVQKALTGTNLSGSFPLAGAVPNYASADWEFGRGQHETHASGGGEVSNSEFLCIALFSDWLSAGELQKWEGYWHWRGGTQAQLPVGHPYLSAAPTTDAGTSFAAFSIPQLDGLTTLDLIGY